MVEDFAGRFVGPMQVQDFLNRFLPDAQGETCPQANFAAVIAQPYESEPPTYDPFVDACENLAPDLEFVNTSAHADPRCVLSGIGLKPDVCAYTRSSGLRRITGFREEISIEFKFDSTHDAFVNPLPASNRKQHCFKRATQYGQDTRGQLITYASAQMNIQFRVFCFSVQVCGRTARLIRWDHAGAVVTAAFDYGKDPDLLAQFFWRYNHMAPSSRGYDKTVSDVNGNDAQRACGKLGIPLKARVFRLQVPDDAFEFDGDPLSVEDYETRKGSQASTYVTAVPPYERLN